MKGFLELHRMDGCPLLVRTSEISRVQQGDYSHPGTQIRMADGTSIEVREEYYHVFRLIDTDSIRSDGGAT